MPRNSWKGKEIPLPEHNNPEQAPRTGREKRGKKKHISARGRRPGRKEKAKKRVMQTDENQRGKEHRTLPSAALGKRRKKEKKTFSGGRLGTRLKKG